MNIATLIQEVKPALLVAVTKHRMPEEIRRVTAAGILAIGENRVQEAAEKFAELPTGVARYFIGRLQTNKVAAAVRLFDMIQSVDNLKLAEKIDAEAAKAGKIMPVLIQVNTSGEPQKGGAIPEETADLARQVQAMAHLKLEGLMTLGVDGDPEATRQCFKTAKRLFDQIGGLRWLSMGMSDDYKIALEEGATMVRLGRKLFDQSNLR